jgi:iron(III) transport system ATP-binding protein
MKKKLEVYNLNKKFSKNDDFAVKNLNFSLNKGDIMVLVGESGSGKTTLLKMLAGLEEPDSGNILLDQQRVLPPSYLLVAGHPKIKLVFQDFHLFPNHNVEDNLRVELRSYSSDYQSIRLQEIMEICELSNFKNRLPRELSGGQKQRVAIAKALASEPELLLLDEPFSHLDTHWQNQFKRAFRKIIRQTKTTTVLVTHNPADALALADKIGVLKMGELIQLDTPSIVYQKPDNLYIAELFGLVNLLSVNFLQKSLHIQSKTKGIIRPENIQIYAADYPNGCKAIIQEIYYLGNHYQVWLKVEKQQTIVAFSENGHLTIGMEVKLKFQTEKIHYLS